MVSYNSGIFRGVRVPFDKQDTQVARGVRAMEATTMLAATNANNAAVEEGRAIPLARVRLDSVDVLRGVIMILMTLDHTRDFLGVTGVNPTDPAETTIPFFSRAGLHTFAPQYSFCSLAPVPICRCADSPRAGCRNFYLRGAYG